ncbi:ATP/GTP-binding protein [Nonomuraea sp. NN258]|uniref:ATP/GTP-binding protein n=1 Tax=Nonomuraea antri TaxID=2730852 RepID=UPI00156942C4|nr:ATP/GTP-binding protein [Nonomuraea antri]NRQ32919.1 ATP/GTP-binding protein [Nonomuraea antri]
MSPRRARRRDDNRPLGFPQGMDKVEEWPDGDWRVRMLTGASSTKTYRCPGCDQEIRAGQPHLVSWPAWAGGDEERRHWHPACWRKRLDRGPGRSRY